MASANPRRTPLYDLHIELGGKIVNFGGWELPVQYATGIVAEHTQCRKKAALFDVSHMGQVVLQGDNITAAFETLVPSDLQSLRPGKARYTVFTNDTGGIRDDLIVSNVGESLFVVVNGAVRDQDVSYMRAKLDGIKVTELVDRALVAVQGPAAVRVVSSLAPAATSLTFMETLETNILGHACRVSRLGYTGEDGFEISMDADRAIEVSRALLAHEDCAPAGLGARDSLRLEAGLCLYGSDLDVGTSPVEAQLSWIIQKRRREERGFPGAERVMSELADGPARKLVGFRPQARAPARKGCEVQAMDGRAIGKVTSGGFSPTLGKPISMGYVTSEHALPGTPINIIVRDKPLIANVVALPFVPHNYKR
ncbi:MAG: glycine cleavage system aminomethyltransferase GcvT [Hyphomicrobiaceae bacterium]